MKKTLLFTALFFAAVGMTFGQRGQNGHHGNGAGQGNQTATHQGPGHGHGQGFNQGHAQGYNHGPPAGMHPADFQDALRHIRAQRFDRDKLRAAKRMASQQGLRSRQVRRIVQEFGFENSRIQFAKFAYPLVADPHNYGVVHSAFQFQSSARDLDRFMAQQDGLVQGHPSNIGYNSGAVGNGGFNGAGGSVTLNGGGVQTSGYGGGMGYHHGGGVQMPGLSQGELHRISDRIQRQRFDDDKLRVARQAVRHQSLRACQVVTLARLFTFEQNRLAFAKFAYRFTCDPQNYYLVNDVFAFRSSVRELDRFILNC